MKKWNASQHFHTIHLSQYFRPLRPLRLLSILLVLVFRPSQSQSVPAVLLNICNDFLTRQNINLDFLPPASSRACLEVCLNLLTGVDVEGVGSGGSEGPISPVPGLISLLSSPLQSPVFTRRSVQSSQSAVDRPTVNISRPARPRHTIGNGFLTNFPIIKKNNGNVKIKYTSICCNIPW